MPMFAAHMVTYGSSGQAAVASAGGGAYYMRRKRWVALMLMLGAVWLL